MRSHSLTWASISLAGVLTCSALGQSPTAPQGAPNLPETVVEGTPAEPAPPPPEPEPPVEQSSFAYSGSPFGDYMASTSSVAGSPMSIFDSSRALSILNSVRINERAPEMTPELLQGMPGILIQRTNMGGGSLIVRGRNGNQNLIMIDGVPINDAAWRFGNVQYLNTIDPGLIERVEVIRGPASVMWGSGATGGVLNIITKRRTDYEDRFGMNGGLISRYDAAYEGTYNRAEFQGNYGSLGIRGGASFLNVGSVYAGQGVVVRNTDYDQTAADVRVDYALADDWLLTVDFQHLFQHEVPRTDRFPSRPTIFDPQQRDFGYVRLAHVDEEAAILNGLQLTMSLQQRKEGVREQRFDRPINQRQSNTFDEILYGGVDLRAITNLSEQHTLNYGARYYRNKLYSTRVRGPIGGTLVRIAPTLPDAGDYDEFGVFLMDRLELTDWLILSGGTRYNNLNASGEARANRNVPFNETFDVWTSEFGAVIRLTENFDFYSNITQGFRAPNLDDLAGEDVSTAVGPDFGTTNLRPEDVWNYEVGVKSQGETFQGSACLFSADYSALIVRQPTPSGGNVRSNSHGIIQGAEIDTNLFLLENWSLFGVLTYTYGQDLGRDEPLRVPPIMSTVGSRYSIPRYGLFLELWSEMMGKQTRLGAVDRADTRVPPGGSKAWQILNTRVGIDLEQYGRLSLGLYNLFDQNYRVLGSGFDALGFEFHAGYDVMF